MKLVATRNIPSEQLDELEQFAQAAAPELRDLLLSLARCARDGGDVALGGSDGPITLTPSQVAERLGMSRAHLYKLLDRGEIMSHRVGRDRRIQLKDIVAYEARRQEARRELAERFARENATRDAAIDEIADLL